MGNFTGTTYQELANYFRSASHSNHRMMSLNCGDRLLVSQRDHGIDLGGATRGDVGRDKRNQCQKARNSNKNRGVARLHLEEQAGHYAGEGKRPNNSDKDADESKFRCLGHNQSQNIAALPAQSHPYADLVRALAGCIGHNSINSDASQYRCE